MSVSFDNLIQEHIAREVAERLPREVSRQLEVVKPLPTWMTEAELAEYWKVGSTDTIRKWRNRPEDEHPLPCANMGDMTRYNREDCDRWAKEEVAWQRERRARARAKEGSHLKAVGGE